MGISPHIAVVVLISCITIVNAAAVMCKHDGQEWGGNQTITVQNAFRIKCNVDSTGSWSTEIIGCLAPNGNEILIGKKADFGDKAYECIKDESGVRLKESSGRTAKCPGGQEYGALWQEKSFRFSCEEGGVAKFIGCVTKDGLYIPKGTTGEVDGFEIKCEQHANGTISMQAANDPKSYECKAKDGSKKKNGEKYVEGNFVRQCMDYGQGRIIGCKVEAVSDTIEINTNVTVNDVIYSCFKEGDQFKLKTYAIQKPTVIVYCSHGGEKYENGSTFITQNSFRMRCVTFENLTSTLEVVSCITPAGIEIPIGAKIEEGNRLFECTPGNISLKSTAGSNGLCKGMYKVGQIWTEDSFKFRCEPYGKVQLTSCITKDGIEIGLGKKERVPAGFVMECVTVDGSIVLRAAKVANCVGRNGETRVIGEVWHHDNFEHKCSEYGISTVIGCYINGVGSIELNKNATKGALTHICSKNGDEYSFKTIATVPGPSI